MKHGQPCWELAQMELKQVVFDCGDMANEHQVSYERRDERLC